MVGLFKNIKTDCFLGALLPAEKIVLYYTIPVCYCLYSSSLEIENFLFPNSLWTHDVFISIPVPDDTGLRSEACRRSWPRRLGKMAKQNNHNALLHVNQQPDQTVKKALSSKEFWEERGVLYSIYTPCVITLVLSVVLTDYCSDCACLRISDRSVTRSLIKFGLRSPVNDRYRVS